MAGIYIHIPFCKRRCIYCDFFSTTQSERINDFISSLCNELELRKKYLDNEFVHTIYFGGGTPSQLKEEHFIKIFHTINRLYTVVPDAEITIEVNPDDINKTYVSMLQKFPFNRISMGIQTFDDETLKLLKRRHDSKQAISAFHILRDAGYDNISLDLMYGLPGETMNRWKSDLETIIQLRPEHISAYHLIYEENTELWMLREKHKVEEANEDLSVSMFSLLIEQLQNAGYEHYEISNFALPNLYSRHNSSYWKGIKYIGCGPSAHSYNIKSRQWNISSLDKYISCINNNESYYETEELDTPTRYNDFVLTSIRTKWGMDLENLKSLFGDKYYSYAIKMAAPHIAEETLERNGNIIRLTKKGIFISDGIMSDMMWV